MSIKEAVYIELLSPQARSKFSRLLDVPQHVFDQAFMKDGIALTKAYYRHLDHVYSRAEMAQKFNKASLSCITGIAIPLAVPFMAATAYTRWSLGRTLQKEMAHLRAIIMDAALQHT